MKQCALAVLLVVTVSLIWPEWGLSDTARPQNGESTSTSSSDWVDEFFPYRLRLRLSNPAEGRIAIDLKIDQMLAQLRKVAVDAVNDDTLAFEKAIVADPETGEHVGRFLLSGRDILPIDGSFDELANRRTSPWQGFDPATQRFAMEQVGGKSMRAMWIERSQIANTKFYQPLDLVVGELYLLEYWVYMDTADGGLSVTVDNPQKNYWPQLHTSYLAALTPQREWVKRRMLVRPQVSPANLTVWTGVMGRAGIAGVQLRPVEWQLTVDLRHSTQNLDLYAVTRHGHRLAQPDAVSMDSGISKVPVDCVAAQHQDFNPEGVLAEGKFMRAWTLPSHFPLRATTLKESVPTHHAVREAQVLLPRGGAATLLIAVEANTPRMLLESVKCDIDLPLAVEQLAEIPVCDSYTPKGGLVERRLDAMVEPNFPLAPPSTCGIHVLALTFRTDASSKVGLHPGTITLKLQNQIPDTDSLTIPVRVKLFSPTLKPMRHFATIFGGQHLTTRYAKGTDTMTKDSVTVAEFHGYDDKMLASLAAKNSTASAGSASGKRTPIRALADKYYHRMIDNFLAPQSVTSMFDYQVTEKDPKQVPTLSNWSFDEFDKGVREFTVGHDLPWLVIHHTNGDLMDRTTLSNGITYSFRQGNNNPAWRRLSEQAYYQLVGDYMEAMAAHLDQLGVLDRALIVVDESDPASYPVIRDYVAAVKSRPHGSRIKFGHTSYKEAAYLQRDSSAELILDQALDITIPDADDHFNHFEPEFNARLKRPKQHWAYFVETDHWTLQTAGVSTVITPLLLKQFDADGWYCWGSFFWSMPYTPTPDYNGPKYDHGPVVNPWLNSFYHHGDGAVAFFYPPDPRGKSLEPTDRIIPSYRLALMRDGIQMRALLEVLEAGKDDRGQAIQVDRVKLERAKTVLVKLFTANPTQWYVSSRTLHEANSMLFEAVGE